MMRRQFFRTLLGCSLLMAGCDTVYEFPPEDGEVDPTLVKFKLTVHLDIEMDYEYSQTVTRQHGTTRPRVIVECYPDDRTGLPDMPSNLYRSAPYRRKVVPVNGTISGLQQIEMEIELAPRPYLFVVWADYSDGEALDDLYYDTSRLYTIGYTERYQGNTALRDAAWATEKIDLSPYAGEWYVELHKEMLLTRPLARYEIITQDLDRFATELARNREKETMSHVDFLEGLEQYRVVVRHAGFCPSEFDAASGRLGNARTGVAFEGSLTLIDEHSALMAFDYLMTGPEESAVTIDMDIYDAEGAMVKQATGIRVPFRRNVLTRVYGNFLTTQYAPHIGIDPEYEGEFNIYL